MRFLAVLENPWCLLILLLIISLLLIAAALQARSRTLPRQTQRLAPQPARAHDVIATAPFEGLAAIHEALFDYRHNVSPNAPSAPWLDGYLHDLQSVMDDVYGTLYQAHGATRTRLLERLDGEVARLDRIVNAYIAAADANTIDERLYTQLERLRQSVDGA